MNTLQNSGSFARASCDEVFSDEKIISSFINRVAEISKTEDPAEACVLLGECAKMLGATSAAYATFLEEDPWRQTYRFVLACHPAWCAEYQKQSWFSDDPWLIYARTNSVAARSSEIPVRTGSQQAIVDLARRFGVASSLIVPIPAAGAVSRVGVLMLGSSHPDFFQGSEYSKFKLHARNLAHEIHEWYVDFMKTQLLTASNLSDQDIELLKLARAGMGTKEIAKYTGQKISAIDCRFQRIIARLKVPSRNAAARLAAEYSVI